MTRPVSWFGKHGMACDCDFCLWYATGVCSYGVAVFSFCLINNTHPSPICWKERKKQTLFPLIITLSRRPHTGGYTGYAAAVVVVTLGICDVLLSATSYKPRKNWSKTGSLGFSLKGGCPSLFCCWFSSIHKIENTNSPCYGNNRNMKNIIKQYYSS